jgi:malonyl CoA-acyl carrier protein transacylase
MNWVAMFPGQGSQKAGMGEELLNLYPDLLIDEFEKTLGWSLKQTILQSDQSEITKTNIAQPYIFAISYCYGLEAFKKLGQPKIGIGHSLGEYTALALSEFISYSDALKIISVRGDSMQKAVENSDSTMAAVLTSDLKKTIDAVEALNNQGVSINISNFNDGSQIVIGGLKDDIDYLKSNPVDLNAKRVIPLDVAGAFHSKFVSSAKKEVQNIVDEVEFSEGKFDVYMNVDAKVADLATIKQRLVDQIDNSVMFYDQILNIENFAKPEKWYHIGPGNVTAGMVKKSISSEDIEIINSLDSLNNI